MKVTVFNDTGVNWLLHSGSERGVNGEWNIPKHSGVGFEVPDGRDVFVKVWGHSAMVRYDGGELATTRRPPSHYSSTGYNPPKRRWP